MGEPAERVADSADADPVTKSLCDLQGLGEQLLSAVER